MDAVRICPVVILPFHWMSTLAFVLIPCMGLEEEPQENNEVAMSKIVPTTGTHYSCYCKCPYETLTPRRYPANDHHMLSPDFARPVHAWGPMTAPSDQSSLPRGLKQASTASK